MATNLLDECLAGYTAQGDACPFYHSSDSWLAWTAGQALNARGSVTPTQCKKSRGYSVKMQTAGADFTFRAVGKMLDQFELVRR